MKISFYKPSIGAEEIDEVVATLKNSWLTTVPRTKQFEREFAAYPPTLFAAVFGPKGL